MVDKNTIFGGMLTLLGAAKKTNCDALGIPWEPRFMLIGDANGTDPVPDPSQTMLVNQVYRAQLNQLYVSPTDNNVLVAELVLPPDVGGWWVRELALEDKDGVFSAVSNVAPSYKPQLAQNSGRNQVVRMHIITSSTANIQLKIDPSVVLATRAYVDTKIMEELYKLDSKQSVRVATTDNIVRSGLLTIDGVLLSAGDRVLVKNQIASKDNGLYIAAAGAWPRTLDADSNAEVTSALLVSVEQGATQADTRWQLVTDGAIVLGTTALTFQNVTQGFALLNSPDFLGTPKVPTPAQFDSSKLAVNSEFVQRAQGNHSGALILSANTTLTASACGSAIRLIGTGYTVTLPALNAIPNGAKVALRSLGSGSIAIALQGTDSVVMPGGPVTSLSMGPGDSVELVALGAVWTIMGGELALPKSAIMSGPNWFTQPQFTNDKSFATTEFLQRALGSFSGIAGYTGAGTLTLTTADVGKHIVVNSATTIVLPAASSVAPGATLHILISGVTDATVTRAGTDTISRNDALTVNSILIKANTAIVLRQGLGGTAWIVCGGDASLVYSPLFGSSVAANGYQKLPSGLIIQQGLAIGTIGALAATYPIAFPNAVLQLTAVMADKTAGSNGGITLFSTAANMASKTTVTLLPNGSDFLGTSSARYIAVGY